MIQRVVKIGTRKSELALYQANLVASLLNAKNIKTEIVEITSLGDEDLTQPIYKLGTSGVFTKNIDIALLNNMVDIAVHSLKDVPTQLPKGISNLATLKRSYTEDVIKLNYEIDAASVQTIATGSIRRKAQWLAKYPKHEIVPLRGNVNTRLQKLSDHDWTGAIFAKAGLSRIDLLGENYIDLNWMVPAPAQGAILVQYRSNDDELKEIKSVLNDTDTEICTTVERDFMNTVEAGCSFPLGAIATIENGKLNFHALVVSPDGSEKAELITSIDLAASQGFGKLCGKQFVDEHSEFINQVKKSI